MYCMYVYSTVKYKTNTIQMYCNNLWYFIVFYVCIQTKQYNSIQYNIRK